MNDDFSRGFPENYDFDAAMASLPTASPTELLAMLTTWMDGQMVSDPSVLAPMADTLAGMVEKLRVWSAEYQQAQSSV